VSKSSANFAVNPETLVDALVDLGQVWDRQLEARQMKIYLAALSDLTADQLTRGFDTLAKEAKFWPRPAEIREYCTGIPAKSTGSIKANQYWGWIVQWAATLAAPRNYKFTRQNIPAPFQCQGTDGPYTYTPSGIDIKKSYSLDSATPRSIIGHGGLNDTKFDQDELVTVEVDVPPSIDPTLTEILVQLEGSVSRGLDRIVAHLESGEDRYLRHNFTECAVAVQAAQNATASYLAASHQLTGGGIQSAPDVVVTRTGLFKCSGKYIHSLSEEQARQLHGDGSITDERLEQHLWTLRNLESFSESGYQKAKASKKARPDYY
jgi:hypothetical protein